MTETLTDEQRTEVRRALLQSIAEVDRGMQVAEQALKLGKFGMGRDAIAQARVLLQMHESIAGHLLKENQRLRGVIDGIDQTLQEDAAAWQTASDRMQEEAFLPKTQRSLDFDHEDLIRYHCYASQAQRALGKAREKIAGQS